LKEGPSLCTQKKPIYLHSMIMKMAIQYVLLGFLVQINTNPWNCSTQIRKKQQGNFYTQTIFLRFTYQQ